MNPSLATLFFLLLLCAPAQAAFPGGPRAKKRVTPHKAKTLEEALKAVKKAEDEYHSDSRACTRADSAYWSYNGAGGRKDENKLRVLRNEKGSACRAELGAETKYLGALSAAIKLSEAHVAEQQQDYDEAEPGEKAKEKQELDKAKAQLKHLKSEYAQHELGHKINPRKR